ncbi:sterol desaturase family protein [Dasania sp. GY-19]|uniref:Sterol desaturase family protein n=1 Tax=Dasania phycosphaerae TaxID=2950436 RepID=A0A9J6RQQ4_9GAMM|nr:sterol desaturase family protein [Dasania phycosphaerae]MCZ0866812.1 sterol desaturase family protein [Dasania phycosphaerae]
MKRKLELLVKCLYLPFFLIAGNGVAIYWVAQDYSTLVLMAWIGFFITLSFLIERWLPFDTAFNRSQGDMGRDVTHALVNESLSILGVVSVPVIASFIPFPSAWPSDIPLWLQVLLAVIIADIGITLAHYASHRYNALWQLHAVHHSVKRMYGFNGLMKHPLHQTVETLAGTTPLLLMGAPQEVLMLLVVAVVIQLLLQHSNVAYFAGPFRYLLAINQVHRFHHLNTAKEGDVNFGLFTTLTDHLLGTAYYEKNKIIRSKDLGIATAPNYPVTYFTQMIEPFKRVR